MRDAKRISRILNLVEEIWMIDPDNRFIQLVDMIKGRYSTLNNDEGKRRYYYKDSGVEFGMNVIDLFHLEDDILEEYLNDLLIELRAKEQ